MNKSEKLRMLLAKFVDFQVIRNNNIAKIPDECAVMHIISINKSAYSGKRIVDKTDEEITEETAVLSEAYYQFDFYAKTQARAEEMAERLLNIIVFEKRNELIRNGFGLSSDDIEIKDLTFLEKTQYIYRFGFDVGINWRDVRRRKTKLIDSIKVEIKEENNG